MEILTSEKFQKVDKHRGQFADCDQLRLPKLYEFNVREYQGFHDVHGPIYKDGQLVRDYHTIDQDRDKAICDHLKKMPNLQVVVCRKS